MKIYMLKNLRLKWKKVPAQSTVASNQLMLPTENSESNLVSAEETREKLTEQTLESTKENDGPKDFSTPANNLTEATIWKKFHPLLLFSRPTWFHGTIY